MSLLLLWICLVYTIGVWLFCTGFVLTRKAIHRKSSCEEPLNHSLSSSGVRSRTPGCGFDNRYDRAIVLLIDGKTNSDSNPINKLFNKYENQSKVYRLLRTPSLSRLQTLESITTGIEQSESNRHTFDSNSQLVEEIKSDDWDLIISDLPLISHFHHLYGSSHPKTINQSIQTNAMLETIMSFLERDNKTILFVISDKCHETSSSFIMTFSAQQMSSFESPSMDVNKIDLVPTLSLLMGTPIPFSNVGKVMSSLFEYSIDCQHVKRSPEFACHEDIPEIQHLWTSISALRINVAQIQRYVSSLVPNCCHFYCRINRFHSVIPIIIWYMLSSHGFFITGHYDSIDSIPHDIPFVTQSKDFWSYYKHIFRTNIELIITAIIGGICSAKN
ncbi:unnamed protein product [Medioppia subpectinata]|uniref:Uncharacterized protein n=1 Tax=Medioppia subpectinata TaxID=1979941 RepID=A0A7R9KMS2_9ACAR|nr:unnamed protein product [Medioppia subpectinata]CAG2106446.1 unnamed protein product [Medioppia subpectinata]